MFKTIRNWLASLGQCDSTVNISGAIVDPLCLVLTVRCQKPGDHDGAHRCRYGRWKITWTRQDNLSVTERPFFESLED